MGRQHVQVADLPRWICAWSGGISLISQLTFGYSIEVLISIIRKVRTLKQLLNLYQAQVRSCMAYCSYLLFGYCLTFVAICPNVVNHNRHLILRPLV